MGWFWSSDSAAKNSPPATPSNPSSVSGNQPRCPVDHSSLTSSSSCPVPSSARHALNPRNNMPNLPNAPIGSSRGVVLPTEREMSTIPMNAKGENWEYPSPQQMLNAMARKGYDDTDAQDVPAMVSVHNWLNAES